MTCIYMNPCTHVVHSYCTVYLCFGVISLLSSVPEEQFPGLWESLYVASSLSYATPIVPGS